MTSNWAAKRQLILFLIFFAFAAGVIFLIYLKLTAPTCADGRQNQSEEGTDCGGQCEKECLGEIKNLNVVWSKGFEISKGKYDAVALVENLNLYLAVSKIKYQLKVYDKDNILIGIRGGETFINPGETFPIFETNINVGERIPEKFFIEFENALNWTIVRKEKPSLVVSSKKFSNTLPFPRLDLTVENKSIFTVENVSAVAILYDKDKNAKAASATKIDKISASDSKNISFTWPQVFMEESFASEAFFRTNLNK